jgi:hypothetical protein
VVLIGANAAEAALACVCVIVRDVTDAARVAA